jgi:class 3 adenylate cyclase/CHAT domain-containing protein
MNDQEIPPQGTGDEREEKIEDIMRARDRLDKILQEKFVKRMTIVFTDVCGYTKYMDTRGDIAGRAWMQKHNDIVLPLIKKNNGKVLTLMGDGVMSSFVNPEEAVKACIDIQKNLVAYNNTTEPADALHVTIGINTGEILVDADHIAGDVVNTASRIETKADPDQILISQSTYEDVRGSTEILCRRHGSVQVNGKKKPLELYRVVWQDNDIIARPTARVRSGAAWTDRRLRDRPSILQLEVTRDDERLKISAFEQESGQINTARQYEEIPIPVEKIDNRCRQIVDTLNACNRDICVDRDQISQLRKMGQTFWDELFTENIKHTFKASAAEHLTISLDDRLVQIPWELLHDGKQFLCQRFSMGRLVKTRQTMGGARSRKLERPLKALILADPEENLASARREGMEIRDFMNQRQETISAVFRAEDINADLVATKLKNFDMVHFAGHSEYNRENPAESGWRLSDGVLKAGEFLKRSQSGIMPVMVFSNACQSARTEEWTFKTHFHDEIFGLANALILSGVKHYIGTFWEILDETGRTFALEFYKHLFAGLTVGEAMRRARLALINTYGEESLVWASYLLYGDPAFNYMDQLKKNGVRPGVDYNREDLEAAQPEEMKLRSQDIAPVAQQPPPQKRSPFIWAGAAVAAVILMLLLVLFSGVFKPDTTQQEQALLVHYQSGNFNEALKTAQDLTARNAEVRLSYLVEGDIYLRRGNLEAAREAYEKALKASKGTDVQKADALIGLGRLASLQNYEDDALRFYEQASTAAPKSGRGYLAQAMLIHQRGNAEAALDLLEKAQAQTPQNMVIAAFANDTRRQVALARDEKKQERIDQLVQELLDSMKQPPRAEEGDGWTSKPLTLWVMDFTTKGFSVQEGEETLLLSGITNQLLENGRVQLVERALLDKLLGELKLGSSELADRRTALAVGKLVAARLIASGTIVYSGPHTQVALRVFETETGRITASVNKTVGSAVPMADLVGQISDNLRRKLDENYPIRGKIVRLDGNTAWINIGANLGVVEGQTYQAVNQETVLEIIAVTSEESAARIVENVDLPMAGQSVEILYQ